MADETQRNPQPMGLHRLAWAAAIIGLPLSHYWLVAKIEPFYSSIYCVLWWSYIFVTDFAVCKLRGTSLLRDRPKEFLFLSVWSVPVWMLFEAVNLRIQNWYYVMAPWTISWGTIFLFLAFGTVLPGIFETMELLVGLLVAGFICGGLWEAWNFTARTKWIYSVPFFDELKLGEMPVLGFVGFPPFALECYALVNFLSLLRGGRDRKSTR